MMETRVVRYDSNAAGGESKQALKPYQHPTLVKAAILSAVTAESSVSGIPSDFN